MTLLDPAALPDADEDDLYEALAALNTELLRRVDSDEGLAATVRALYPTATGLLCDADWSPDYVTAAPAAVLLADGTTVTIDRNGGDETSQQAWLETCDAVADLAAVDGAIVEDPEHGPMIRFGPAPSGSTAPASTGDDPPRSA